MLIVRAVAVHVLEAVVDRSPAGAPMVNLERLAPVSRLGGDTYARITEARGGGRGGREGGREAAGRREPRTDAAGRPGPPRLPLPPSEPLDIPFQVYDLPRPGKEWQARRAAPRVAAA